MAAKLSKKPHKCSVIQGFIYRIYRTCSSWKKFHESLIKAKDISERKQYPPNFYECIISATIQKFVKPFGVATPPKNPKTS